MNDDCKCSPLNDLHVALGGKLVPFAGWSMPVQYTSIMDEHAAIRENLGIFDISHMGQFFVEGRTAEKQLNQLLANNVTNLKVGEGQYSFLLNEQGGVIDDLIIYRSGEASYFLVVNASMIDEDRAWVEKHLSNDLVFRDESNNWAGMAVQGPNAESCAKSLGFTLPKRNGIAQLAEDGETLIICRTGYTGEDGFEFFCPASSGAKWFRRFIDAGAKPCGLGARDSLRLEMCYPLNGSDLSPSRTPLEAGLGFFVDLEKAFIGREVLLRQKQDGLKEKLVALKYTDKGAPPRAHYAVENTAGEVIGELSSGVLSPSLKEGIALAYLPIEFTALGTKVQIDVRGRKFPAIVVKKPFYKKP